MLASKPYVIGLTGGIGSGKTEAARYLESLGAARFDADEVSRALTAPGGAALPAIRAAFGEDVFQPDGTLDRRALGSVVFGNENARARLNRIIHPLVKQLTHRRIEEARLSGASLCVLDMPLLYEADMAGLCDCVWCVWLPRDEQLRRLMARDGFTRQEAEARIASQLSADEKAARADVVIDTSGSIEYTKSMIPALYAKELELA